MFEVLSLPIDVYCIPDETERSDQDSIRRRRELFANDARAAKQIPDSNDTPCLNQVLEKLHALPIVVPVHDRMPLVNSCAIPIDCAAFPGIHETQCDACSRIPSSSERVAVNPRRQNTSEYRMLHSIFQTTCSLVTPVVLIVSIK